MGRRQPWPSTREVTARRLGDARLLDSKAREVSREAPRQGSTPWGLRWRCSAPGAVTAAAALVDVGSCNSDGAPRGGTPVTERRMQGLQGRQSGCGMPAGASWPAPVAGFREVGRRQRLEISRWRQFPFTPLLFGVFGRLGILAGNTHIWVLGVKYG